MQTKLSAKVCPVKTLGLSRIQTYACTGHMKIAYQAYCMPITELINHNAGYMLNAGTLSEKTESHKNDRTNLKYMLGN
jgi:hypothetical protein